MYRHNQQSSVLLPCVFGLVLFSLGLAQVPDRSPSAEYPYITNMDQEGNYILRWNFDSQEIRFQIQVRTTGYVAFGISENGLMVPADVVVGYVDGQGTTSFRDFHTVGYRPPAEDRVQDWELENGREQDGWTILAFKRRLDTCDVEEDRPITADTLQLLYAYDARDPQDLFSLFHHDFRGSKAVNLLRRSKQPTQLPTDLQTIDFVNANYTIPSEQPTSYFCRVFNLSHVTTKYHAIKVSPIFTRETEINVHYMVLYRCKIRNASVVVQTGEGAQCFTDAPDHIQFCREFVAGFGQGGEDMFFPDDVGLPVGGVGEPDIYVLAIHYDNSDYMPGLVDNSGIRVMVTSQLRQHEGAFLSMGNIISQNWLQFIPPGEGGFVQKAYCSQRCLAWGFLGSGNAVAMTVAGVQFHSHDIAKQMRVRHMTYVGRNRVQENPWIAEDKSYSAQAQSFRVLDERKQVGYWDNLLLECTYNSTERDRPTVGGWTNYDEICRAYLFYYPRKAIDGCMSWSAYNRLQNANGENVPGSQVFQTLATTDWATDRVMRRNLRRALDRSIEYAQCWSSTQEVPYGFDYFRQPRVTNVYTEAPKNTCPSTRIAFDAQMFG